MLLSNRVAIITGGAKGIGRGIALKFAEEGCAVVIADVLEKEGKRTSQELSKKGVEGVFVKCDVTDSRQILDMAEQVVKKFGKVDILVNNAGAFGPPIPTTDLTEEAWDRMLNLNLKGVFQCCKAVIPHMIEKRYGKIINISSAAAIAGGPPQIHYNSAKGGVLSLTIALAVELGSYNICVNAILPGIIRTDLWHPNVPPGIDEDKFFQQLGEKLVLLQRVGTPEDVALVALFLASDLSRYVTGDRVLVGGGVPLAPPFID
jgi:NAD(P)-dependent dehydrogenase (short-subunit alcohol dehydrogenase family)